ncbi:oxidoreductase-like protein [Scheffersomyces xylosifermentans]|uniref:oxidoreductase-like protein n=1 Tax=Scheffersomyces xylosifermentans TaxID=1304137 RepID=UPI00315DB39F
MKITSRVSTPVLRRFQSTAANAAARAANVKKYAFYDLVLRTPSHPTHPLESSMMSDDSLNELKKHTKTTFEGKYTLDNLTAEQKISRIFGGRIKGENRKSSSRLSVGEPKVIAGITVPARPREPDNCCMSGCINCVWELFNDDIKDWDSKRKIAAKKLVEAGGRWPENFHAPLKYLNKENYPLSVAKESPEVHSKIMNKEEDENWAGVPVAIKVFAETEKLLKAKRRARENKGTTEVQASA